MDAFVVNSLLCIWDEEARLQCQEKLLDLQKKWVRLKAVPIVKGFSFVPALRWDPHHEYSDSEEFFHALQKRLMGPPWWWDSEDSHDYTKSLQGKVADGNYDPHNVRVPPTEGWHDEIRRAKKEKDNALAEYEYAVRWQDHCFKELNFLLVEDRYRFEPLIIKKQRRMEALERCDRAERNLWAKRKDWFRQQGEHDTRDRCTPPLPTTDSYKSSPHGTGQWLIHVWQKIRGPPWWLGDLRAYDYVTELEEQMGWWGPCSSEHARYRVVAMIDHKLSDACLPATPFMAIQR